MPSPTMERWVWLPIYSPTVLTWAGHETTADRDKCPERCVYATIVVLRFLCSCQRFLNSFATSVPSRASDRLKIAGHRLIYTAFYSSGGPLPEALAHCKNKRFT